ncbi:NrdH-redoxin [Vibrio sp. 10N.286.49.C2]|uniref:glutaredoxin family protein n=1 Tax=unclassified Vibrio TaxID=2614977 RepID=UPI000C852F37|nr:MULTISPECIES: glutaredoxin domain-containing protein [unclassified Vibrio]PMH42893.1 NrdH-redoxin [Vibrio sp. 10N.286.49.C2]PMH53768.1 NrdH-redoxin [Vibrio sp. 10N.286.49.B1]PMH81989.1 NrdH-redoxin [Vibrio sp. 10N.286.48.B7]
MKFIRIILGKIILVLNFVFSPRGVKRTAEAQNQANEKAKTLSLYQFEACPFCVKVRREMKRQSVNITLKDAKNDDVAREQLLEGGGRVKVPCLKIEKNGQVEWMYESGDIVNYLQKEFA